MSGMAPQTDFFVDELWEGRGVSAEAVREARQAAGAVAAAGS